MIGSEAIEAVADRGSYSGEEILACEQAGATVYLPKLLTSGVNANLRSASRTSSMSLRTTSFRLAGERLIYHFTNEEDGKILRR